MPKISPNRLRDRLRRILSAKERTVFTQRDLALELFSSDMEGVGEADPLPTKVIDKLTDLMRNVRKEELARGRNPEAYRTVRGQGYEYAP